MKKTQRKDAWKNIIKQKVSFLSIIVIAAMAVTAYLGLSFASRAIANNADRFYDATNFHDAEIVSTLLLSEDDLNTLRGTDGVADVEAVWLTSGAVEKQGEKKNAAVRSLTERIDTPLLVSGRLPEAENECVVEWEIAKALSIEVGDNVRIEGAQYLRTEAFIVCAIAKNAEYATNEINVHGDRIVYVLPSVFDLDALDGCCMKALLRYTDCDGLNRFDKAYLTAASDMTQRIEALSGGLADRRTDAIRTEYGTQIADGEAELDSAKRELDDARRQLDDGWKELQDGEDEADAAKQKLDDAEQQLEDAKKLLSDGEAQLSDGAAQLYTGKLELDKALDQLTEGQAQLDDAKAQLSDSRQQLDDGWAEYHENEALLADAAQQLSDGWQQLSDGEEELNDAKAQLSDSRQQLDDGWAEYHENEALLADAKRQLDDGKAQLDDGQRQLDEAGAELAEAKQKLDDGEAQYEAAGKQLEAGRRSLNSGAAALSSGREQLVAGAAEIEAGKDTVRNALKSSLDVALGRDTGAWLDWTPDGNTLNPDNPNASATRFAITNEITLNLNKSLEANIADVLTLLVGKGVTEEDLKAWVEGVYGVIELLPGDSFISAAARRIAGTYAGYDAQYELLADGARKWDTGHAQYLDGLAEWNAGADEYNKRKKQYELARKELDEGWEAYDAGLAQYEAGLAQFEEKKAEYDEALAQYSDGTEKLKSGLAALEQGEADYATGLEAYEEGMIRLTDGWAEYYENLKQYDDGAARLADGLAKLNEGEADYASALAEFEAGSIALADGWAQYNAALAKYNGAAALLAEKSAEYEDGLKQYADGKIEYEEGAQEYRDGLKELEEGRAELEDGERRYAQSMEDYLTGVQTVSEAKESLDGLDECRWVILGESGNASYRIVKFMVKNVSDLALTFALIFILVAALVIYATLGRIVAEQRRLVGATRALGLYKKEILAKYLVFGVGATLTGMLLGVVLAYFFIQTILTSGYGQFYNFDNTRGAFSIGVTLAVLSGGIVLAVAAVCLACTDLLRSNATSLMQEKVPTGRKSGSSGAKGRSLYTRLILMNIRTDLKRVAVTVVSVAGCCALLVTGFTMRNGIVGSVKVLYDRVFLYDDAVFLSPDSAEAEYAAARSALERAGASSIAVQTYSQKYSINGELSVNDMVCADLTELQPFFARLDLKTGQELPTEPEGIWICRKVSEVGTLQAGDSITLYDDAMHPYSATVAGIFESFMSSVMLMSPESYEQIFGAPPENNALLVSRGSMQADELEQLLASLPGVERVRSNAVEAANLYAVCKPLNLISLLMVGIAGIMACFIILNLINIHVTQKKRELTIMRVNGFTVREVIAYIAREAIVTNLLGIVLGLGAGMLLAYKILRLLEGATARFLRAPQPIALVLAVLITAGFSVILNMIALRKIKYLKLTDVA